VEGLVDAAPIEEVWRCCILDALAELLRQNGGKERKRGRKGAFAPNEYIEKMMSLVQCMFYYSHFLRTTNKREK